MRYPNIFQTSIQVTLLTLLLMITTQSCSAVNPGPAETVKRFNYAVEAGKLDEAKSYLTKSGVAQWGTKFEQAFPSLVKQMQEKGGIKSQTTDKEEIRGDLADVVVTVTFGNNTKDIAKNPMVREDGKWKISFSK